MSLLDLGRAPVADEYAGLRYYQADAVRAIRAALETHRSDLLVMATGLGKCLGRGTPVLRYDGDVVPVEQVRAGDLLMGPDSNARRVLTTTRGTDQLYRIRPIKGAPWVCNAPHVLTLVHTSTGRIVDVPLNEWLEWNANQKHLHKLFQPPVVHFAGQAQPLPIDPYFMGVWFGDGTRDLSNGGVKISKPDKEIHDCCVDVARRWGLRVSIYQSAGKCPTFALVGERSERGRGHRNPLAEAMKSVVGDGQRLPRPYITASFADRCAFLAGLLDTDGHRTGGCYEIVQDREGVADDIAFLARSLGLRVSRAIKIVQGKPYYRLHLSGDATHLPLRIPRKKPEPRRQKKDALRTGFAVEPIGEGEYFGFELDGDGRFLLGDFTVTHNTQVFGAVARSWPGKVLVIAHRDELIDQARKRIEQMSGEWVEREQGPYYAQPTTRIVVASVQTIYQKHRLERFGADHFSLIVIDEAHHAPAKTYRNVVDFFADAKVLGVTATPDRKDKKAMGIVFESNSYTLDIEDGIEAGYLVPIVGQRVHLDEIDLSTVKSVAGDLQQGQLEEAMLPAVEGVVRKTLELYPDRKAICFFPGVKNAQLACEVFNRQDPESTCFLSGEVDDDEREQIVRDFRKGKYKRLCNCAIATEGFDSPDVSLIVGARPTKSRALYAQICGRGTRVLPDTVEHIEGPEGAAARRAAIAASAKRDMVMLDFVGNSGKHTLCTIEDVLGGKYTEAERGEAKRKTGTGAANTRDALREARKAIAAAAAAVEAAKIKARVEMFNPFKVLGVDDVTATALEQRMHNFQPIEQRQVKMLEKFGYTDKDLKGASKRQADKLIAESIRRTRGGLASFRQLKLLQRYGVTDTNITKQRAHAAISYLESVGWGHKMVQTPFGEAKGRVDPRELNRILRSRTAGEEG